MIVSTETGGLGNRLKSWVSAMRLDPDARVYWPLTDNMPARFEDLFENDCAVEDPPDGATLHRSWRLAVLPEDEPHLPAGFATVGAGAHPIVRGLGKLVWQMTGRRSDRYQYMVFPKQHSRRSTRADARHIDLEYGRIPEYFRRVYAPLFQRVVIRASIRSVVDRWAVEHLAGPVAGVQVRTWRDDPRRHRKYHKPSVKRLRRLMEAVPAEHRFFVVTDSDEVVPDLARAYGADRVLSFPRTTARHESWKTAAGMIEDLADMLLLARTRRLFASYLSTFSETAWWLGGATADVAVF
jgi:hypothetical protein